MWSSNNPQQFWRGSLSKCYEENCCWSCLLPSNTASAVSNLCHTIRRFVLGRKNNFQKKGKTSIRKLQGRCCVCLKLLLLVIICFPTPVWFPGFSVLSELLKTQSEKKEEEKWCFLLLGFLVHCYWYLAQFYPFFSFDQKKEGLYVIDIWY